MEHVVVLCTLPGFGYRQIHGRDPASPYYVRGCDIAVSQLVRNGWHSDCLCRTQFDRLRWTCLDGGAKAFGRSVIATVDLFARL